MDNLPNEMYLEVFSYFDLPAFRNARLVSKKWKYLVVDACPQFHFIFPLSDATIPLAKDITEEFLSLHVHDFTGNGNEAVSPTSGTGLLFGSAEWIQFFGNNNEPLEIPKMLKFAEETVKNLSFKGCGIDIMRPFLNMTLSFSALRELSIVYAMHRQRNDSFNLYTEVLQSLAAPNSGVGLASLESLKLSFIGSVEDDPPSVIVSSENMFRNFLAMSKFILKYRRTLKELKIGCFGATDQQGNIDETELNQAELTEMRQCIAAFNELNLTQIQLFSIKVRGNPWILETELVQRQQNLRIVIFHDLWFPHNQSPILAGLLPQQNLTLLTTVKILGMTFHAGDPVDLGILAVCSSLRTLWLEFYQPMTTLSLQFRNIEQLPRQIKSLRLKSNRGNRIYPWRQQAILTSEQIQWITENLRDLESFWLQLVLPVEVQQNENDENVGGIQQAGGVDFGEQQQEPDQLQEAQRPQQENVNRPRQTNINLDLFRSIISMPKIWNLKCDMLKQGHLQSFGKFITQRDDIQGYIGICNAAPNVVAFNLSIPSLTEPVRHPAVFYSELTVYLN